MNLLNTPVPVWVSILFILTFPIVIFLIANTAKKAALQASMSEAKSNRLWWSIVGFYLAFLAYTTVLSALGFFDELTLPPRILLFTAIPLLLFYVGFMFRTKLYPTLLRHASLESLIRIHQFRFVGVFFLINLWYDALPQRFALVAGIGDILSALLAIWVARQVAQRRPGSYWAVLIWNCIGLLDIMSVIVTAMLTANQALAGNAEALRLNYISLNPFCWIGALAPATIIFLHVTIFKKLAVSRKQFTADTLVTRPSVAAAV
jgi:hypothetical protein